MSGARASARSAASTTSSWPHRWGAHELSPGWARRIVASAGAGPDDLVLDMGAGRGALTLPLAALGAHVVAVELHPRRVAQLRGRVPDGVTVVEGDLLRTPLPRRPFRVVANPPYDVAAALVRRLADRGSALVRGDLVLPRWQVNRYLAAPPRGFTAQLGRHVPASAFRPPPRNDSAVLVLRRRSRRS